MATGTLGQSSLAATTNTTVYTVPVSKIGTVSINICNRSATNPVMVRLAVAASGTPANAEWVEYDAIIAPNSVLERTGIVMSASKNVVAYSSAANVSVNVYGYEA